MQKTKTLSFTKLDEYTYDLMHELSHQLTIPDHYCYDPYTESPCSNLDCDRCYKNLSAIRECIMGYRYDDVCCNDCINTINNYLDTYF